MLKAAAMALREHPRPAPSGGCNSRRATASPGEEKPQDRAAPQRSNMEAGGAAILIEV